MSEQITMDGVREYAEGFDVGLASDGDRLTIHAKNQGGYDCTDVDLLDVLHWVKRNRPDLLDQA